MASKPTVERYFPFIGLTVPRLMADVTIPRSASFSKEKDTSSKCQSNKIVTRSTSCFASLSTSDTHFGRTNTEKSRKTEPSFFDENPRALSRSLSASDLPASEVSLNKLLLQRSKSAFNLTWTSSHSDSERCDTTIAQIDTSSDDNDETRGPESLLQRIVSRTDNLLEDFFDICAICYSPIDGSCTSVSSCATCCQMFCSVCLKTYFKDQVGNGCILVTCPEFGCGRPFKDSELLPFITREEMTIYLKNQAESRSSSNTRLKACPGCNVLHRVPAKEPIPERLTCKECSMEWCFICHAPWHNKMTCKSYMEDVQGEGQKALKVWAKSKGKNVKNARKCPKCHFFIERIAGCDHMTCSKCKTEFCYSCGKRFLSLGILGNHFSRFSFLGCKNNLSPDRPACRVAVRGAIAVLSPIVVVGAIGTAPLTMPVLGSIWLVKRIKRHRRR